jgi:hypothetical protein
MGDSQYWTSLWVLGLFIVLSLVCFSLVGSIFSFFYDRISTYEIWNSPAWLKLKIPLIVLGVIGFVAAAIIFSRHLSQRELKAAQDYAQARGWGFSRKAEEGFTAQVAEILSDLKLDLYHIRTVEKGWRRLYLFDCTYNNRNASSKSNHDSYGTACLVLSKRFHDDIAPVEIVTRDWTEVMQSDKVNMGESPFARRFLVLSKDPDSAKRIVNESIQAILLEHRSNPHYYPTSITIGPGGAVVLTGRTAEHERLQDIMELARKLESAVR